MICELNGKKNLKVENACSTLHGKSLTVNIACQKKLKLSHHDPQTIDCYGEKDLDDDILEVED